MAKIAGKSIASFLKVDELPVLTVFIGAHVFDHDIATEYCRKLYRFSHKDGEILSFFFEDSDVAQVLGDLGDCGFFTASRLAFFKGSAKKAKGLAKYFNRWLENAPQDTHVVISLPGLLARSVFLKELDKAAKVYNFPQLSRWEYPERASSLIHSSGLKFDREPHELLLSAYEGDLAGLKTELEKISTWLGNRKTVRRADLEEISTAHASANKFELVDRITRRDMSSALELLERLMREGEQPQVMLATMLTEIRKVLFAAELQGNFVPEYEIEQKLGIKYKPREFLSRAKRFKERFEAEKVLEILTGTERLMKTSAKPPELVLQECVCRLISQGS